MKRPLLSGVGVILCAAGMARADIEVKQYNVSGAQVGVTDIHNSGDDFTITVHESAASIVVRSNDISPSSESIGRIKVENGSGASEHNVKLYIAQSKDLQDIEFYPTSDPPACHDWAGIEDHRGGGTLALKAHIGGNLTGTIIGATSSAPYTRLNTLQVEGTIGAKVYAHDGYYLVECKKAVATNGTAIWSDTDIGLVRATVVPSGYEGSGGVVLAGRERDLSKTYTIDWIDAPNGFIGGDPTACHELPSQAATLEAGLPPALVNPPATYSVAPTTVIAAALANPLLPVRPLPSVCHAEPSQRATAATDMPPLPRVVKSPPAIRSPAYSLRE